MSTLVSASPNVVRSKKNGEKWKSYELMMTNNIIQAYKLTQLFLRYTVKSACNPPAPDLSDCCWLFIDDETALGAPPLIASAVTGFALVSYMQRINVYSSFCYIHAGKKEIAKNSRHYHLRLI